MEKSSSPSETSLLAQMHEFKKQATIIKNEQGSIKAIEFLKAKIEELTQFRPSLTLLKRLSDYLKKEKSINNSDSLVYIHWVLEKCKDSNDVEFFSEIGEVIHKIDLDASIDYLNRVLPETITQNHNAYVPAVLLLATYYSEKGETERSYNTIHRAQHIINSGPITWQTIFDASAIHQTGATIFETHLPKESLYFDFSHFILSLIMDSDSSFEHSKNSWLTGEFDWFSDRLKERLLALEILNHEETVKTELYEEVFHNMPVQRARAKLLVEAKYPNDNLDVDGLMEKRQRLLENHYLFATEYANLISRGILDKYLNL